MANSDLKAVLTECEKSAKTGYKIALIHEKKLNSVLSMAENKVRNTLLEFNSSACYSPEATVLLENQLMDIERDFMNLSFAFKEDLENF